MIEPRMYVAVDMVTGEWVSGDDYRIYTANNTVWLRVYKNNKRRTIKEKYWVVPSTLHCYCGLTADGKFNCEKENLSWSDAFNDNEN